MPERNLHDDLDALARYAATTGELRTAADVRGRGDRRRRNSTMAATAMALVVAGGLGYGILQARPDGGTGPAPAGTATPTANPSPAPSTSPSTSPDPGPSRSSAPSSGASVPAPDRQVMLLLADDAGERALSVAADNTLGTYPMGGDTGERELFVLTPLSPGKPPYHLETVLRTGGERSCVAAASRAAELTATACDAGAAPQNLTLIADGTDAQGRTAYRLRLGGLNVTVTASDGQDPDRVTGENGAGNRFVFSDQGKAPASAGD